MLYGAEQLGIKYCCYGWEGLSTLEREARCKGVILCIHGNLYVCFTLPAVMLQWQKSLNHLFSFRSTTQTPCLASFSLIYLSFSYLPPASSVRCLSLRVSAFLRCSLPSLGSATVPPLQPMHVFPKSLSHCHTSRSPPLCSLTWGGGEHSS